MKNGKSNNSETLTICWLFILFIESIFGKTFETKLTSEVSVNSKDCFYEKIYVGDSFQVNYQVLKGGDFDISFDLYDPFDNRMVSDFKQTSKMHDLISPVSGDYKFCFDNSFSQYSIKVIYFYLSVEPMNQSEVENSMESFSENSHLDNQYYGLKTKLAQLHEVLKKSNAIQSLISAIEFRGRSIAEQSFERINLWSSVHLSIMIFSALLNIFLIRNLFAADHKSGVSKMKT